MPKTLIQKVIFKNQKASALYSMYLNSSHHTKMTGGKASIRPKVGTSFSAWDGYIIGKNLQLISNSLIVQSWRAPDWDNSDADSTLVLLLEQTGKDVRLTMTHANVPDKHVSGIKEGWRFFPII